VHLVGNNELLEVATALTKAAEDGQVSVLATVARTEGSTYRRIGARMVVLADGSHAGGVSAGCLEADVVLRAAGVRASGRPDLVTYDTRSADDLIWGFGLGCGGLTELLLEPLDPEAALAKAERFRGIAASRERMVLATVVRTSGDAVTPGDQAMLDERGILTGFEGLDPSSRAIVHRTASGRLEAGSAEAARHTLNGHEVDIAYEIRLPTVRLGVCGAGPDAIPVVAAAQRLGWHVTLMDHRPTLIAQEQWPAVERTVVPSVEAIPGAVARIDCDAVVVMNHHYDRDLEYLAAWVGTSVPYIGVLGPRQRSEQMLATLESRGVELDEATRQRIRAPVGLDIGAETPEEVALAIVGEIQAVHAERRGGFLSTHGGPIHGPVPESVLETPGWTPSR
jgi:xanthine/CO dehydrogenase XdhC/CoxF family maturation factor